MIKLIEAYIAWFTIGICWVVLTVINPRWFFYKKLVVRRILCNDDKCLLECVFFHSFFPCKNNNILLVNWRHLTYGFLTSLLLLITMGAGEAYYFKEWAKLLTTSFLHNTSPNVWLLYVVICYKVMFTTLPYYVWW